MTDDNNNRACCCPRCSVGRLMGAAVLTTLGVLFLLGEFTRWDFGDTWPILLIVMGVVKVLQSTASTEGHATVMPPPAAPGSPSDSSQVPHV